MASNAHPAAASSGLVRRREASVAIPSAVALAYAGSSERAEAQAIQLVVVNVNVVAKGFRISKLLGKGVQNDKNEKIGTLDDVIVTDDQKLFSILQVGDFLGLGGHLVAVPYAELQVSDDGRKIVLPGASKAELEHLPEFRYLA